MSDFNAEQQKVTAAVTTLEFMRYTWTGGIHWRPPIGKKPDFDLMDSLQAKVDKLQAEVDQLKSANASVEPVAYMFPHDLRLFQEEETAAYAYSVAMGNQDGETVPLYAEPQIGSWYRADDIDRLVRELDVAINGEAGAAPQAMLCDLVTQVKQQGFKIVPAGCVVVAHELADDLPW